MNKRIYLLIGFLVSNFTFAQVETVQYQGKTYFVYPHAENEPSITYEFEYLAPYTKKRVPDPLNPDKTIEMTFKEEEYEDWRKKEKRRMENYLLETPFIFYENNISLNSDLPPVIESIPDGNYIQYYHHLPYIEGDTLKYNYTTVAAIFSIKNNLAEGPACWFTAAGDTIKCGSFSQGLKQGVWRYNQYDEIDQFRKKVKDILNKKYTRIINTELNTYQKGELEGLCIRTWYDLEDGITTTIVSNMIYHENSLNGAYSETENGQVRIKGTYKNGERSGEWFYYQPKADFVKDEWVSKRENPEPILMKHYTIAETPKTGKSVIIRGHYYESKNDHLITEDNNQFSKDVTTQHSHLFPAYSYYGDGNGDNSFSSFYRIPNEAKKEKNTIYRGTSYKNYRKADFMYIPEYSETKAGEIMRFSRQELIDSLGYQFLYDGVYEDYYPNGQLRLKFEVRDGILQGEDTVFWYNGKPANVVNFIPETQQYEEKMFSVNGELEIHRLFDEHGKFQKLLKDKNGVCLSHLEKEGRLYFESDGLLNYANPFRNELTEKTMLSEKLFKKDSSLCERVELDPITRIYTRITRSIDDQYYSEESYLFDSLYEHFTGTEYIRFQNVETFSMEKLDRLESTFRVEGSAIFSSSTNSPQQKVRYLICETVFANDPTNRWMLNGHPFTGSFVLNMDENEFSVRASNNQVIINIQNEYEYLVRVLIFTKPLLEHDFNRSNYTYSPNGRFEPKRYEGSFLDGRASGQWQVLNDYKHKLFTTQFDQGKIYGNSYSLEYKNKITILASNPPKKSKRNTRYLESFTPLKNGILDGIYLQYDSEGIVKQQLEYKAGLRQGWALDRTNSNQIFINQYLDDRLNGICYTLDRWGDTIEISSYVSGLKEGKAFFKHGSFIQEVEYQHGKLMGNYQLYELFPDDRKTKPYVNCQVNEGKAHGLFETHNNHGVLIDRAVFQDGFVSDSIEKYNEQGFLLEKIKLQGIFMKEQEIWKNGTRFIVNQFDLNDSLLVDYELAIKPLIDNLLLSQHSRFVDVKLTINTKETKSSFSKKFRNYTSKITYHQTTYYVDGIKKSEGNITNGEKKGVWKYFDPSGKQLYVIDFKDSSFYGPDSLFFRTVGVYAQLDAAGDTITKSHLIGLESNYNCDHLEYQEVYTFYTFWEKDAGVGKRNGYVKNYYPDGTLQSQGQMKNGLPEGTWMYYDPFGGLFQLGNFERSMRNGRWLKGDLSKIAYIGDICLNPNLPHVEEEISKLEKHLKIELTYYEKGLSVSVDRYSINKE